MSSRKYRTPHQNRVEAANRVPLFNAIRTEARGKSAPNADVLEDTLRGYSPYYSKYGVSSFHERGVWGAGVSVVVIDSGLISAKSELLQNIHLISLRRSGSKSESGGPHGIAVASLLAARSPTSKLTGIAPDATVTLIDVDDVDGEIKLSTVLLALTHALQLKPDIVNISLGTDAADDDLHAGIRALTDQGILVFAAAGNSGTRMYEFPASCPGVICVGSMNARELPSTFNSRNDTVTVFAPGERFHAASVKDAFAVTALDGTSFASPFAAAMLALHLSDLRKGANPTLSVSRDDAITFLRAALNNDCSRHMYVQERFSDFGCSAYTFSGDRAIISAPTCAPQFRMAILWMSVSICLAGALAITLFGRTGVCTKMCKVIFSGKSA